MSYVIITPSDIEKIPIPMLKLNPLMLHSLKLTTFTRVSCVYMNTVAKSMNKLFATLFLCHIEPEVCALHISKHENVE